MAYFAFGIALFVQSHCCLLLACVVLVDQRSRHPECSCLYPDQQPSQRIRLGWMPDGTLYLDWLDSGTVKVQSTIWRLANQAHQWEQLRAINQHCNNPTLQRIAGTADKLGLACIIGVKIVRCRLARFFTIYPPRQSAPYSHLISRPKVGIFGMCNDRKGWCPVEIFLAPCNG
jgi:hypothetical protein